MPTIEVLFEEHHHVLLRYLIRFSGDTDLASDAAQEAFVRALERPPRDGVTRAWLFTVATNYVIGDRRTRVRRSQLLDRMAPVPDRSTEGNGDDDLLEAERRRHLRAALVALPPKERAALLMQAEGFAYKEIAAALDTTPGSVGPLLSRGLARLGTRLRAHMDAL